MSIDAFASAVQPQGCFGAVFERDDETAYFYLLDLRLPEGRRIVGTFRLADVVPMPQELHARVSWTIEGDMVGRLVVGRLEAVFDLASERTGKFEGRRARADERARFLDA